MASRAPHQEHFESIERQGMAATLGMWVFLSSEILFFGALFTTYASYRAQAPVAFAEAVKENTFWWGSANTVVLLTTSFLVALAVHGLRHDQSRRAARLVLWTALLGGLFLCVKGYEYYDHFFHAGIFPGGYGHWFIEKERRPGSAAFWTLYYLMTGLHALHVIIGVVTLLVIGRLILTKHVTPAAPHILENGALYWHLVDIMWLFLWPLFYLTKGHG